jgi:hypothetical protein
MRFRIGRGVHKMSARPTAPVMAIHQIQVRYDELQDRVLLRLSTTDAREFRFWLTRRFVKRLWGVLLKLLEQDRPVRQQVDGAARRAVLGIQHEGFVSQGNYSEPYEDREYGMPLGTEPVLIAKGQGRLAEGAGYLLRLQPETGQGVDLSLDTKLLHIFAKLLSDAVARTDWDMRLEIRPASRETGGVEASVPPKLN